MKKMLTTLVVFLLAISATQANAQEQLIARGSKPGAGFAALLAERATDKPSHPVIVSKRSKRFTKGFTGITDAVWGTDGTGYVARFTSAGIQNWAFVTKQGKIQSSMRYYTAAQVPAAVRNQIEEAYYDFVITSAKEVHTSKTTTYLITIADATTWKVIQVVDGETYVWEEHAKG